MKLSQLHYLVALSKYGTISRTAEKLYISQPTLSIAIKELEEELGFDIIKRTRKGTIFTSRGEQVLSHCLNIEAEIAQIQALGADQEHFLAGRISIGSVPYIMHSLILDMVMALKRRFSELTLNLIEDNSYDLVEQVFRRDLDAGIIMVSNIEEARFREKFKAYRLDFIELFQDEMFVWCGQQNPLYKQTQVSLAEALKYPFVVYRDVLNTFNRTKLQGYNNDIELVHVDDKQGVRKYLSMSQAVTIMPMCTISEDHHYFDKGYIKPLMIEDFSWTVRLGLVLARDEQHSIEVQEFTKMLQAQCAALAQEP